MHLVYSGREARLVRSSGWKGRIPRRAGNVHGKESHPLRLPSCCLYTCITKSRVGIMQLQRGAVDRYSGTTLKARLRASCNDMIQASFHRPDAVPPGFSEPQTSTGMAKD